MRYCAIDPKTETPTPVTQNNRDFPPDAQFVYLARIRCFDCSGKLYTPGPDTTVGNFEVHIKNRLHRERVTARVEAAAAAKEPANVPAPAPNPNAGGQNS